MISGYSAYVSDVTAGVSPSASSTSLGERIFRCPSMKPGGTALLDAAQPTRIKKMQPAIRYLREQYIPHRKIWAGLILTTPAPCKLNLRKRQRPSAAAVRRRVEQACARHDRQLRTSTMGIPLVAVHAVAPLASLVTSEVVRGVEVTRLIVTAGHLSAWGMMLPTPSVRPRSPQNELVRSPLAPPSWTQSPHAGSSPGVVNSGQLASRYDWLPPLSSHTRGRRQGS